MTEEFQKNVYINNLQLLEKIDGLVGTSPWILKDFRSARRVLNGIQDYSKHSNIFIFFKFYSNKIINSTLKLFIYNFIPVRTYILKNEIFSNIKLIDTKLENIF